MDANEELAQAIHDEDQAVKQERDKLLDENAALKEMMARPRRSFLVHDVLRMPHYDTVGRGAYRVWKVVAVHLGGENQEGSYELEPVDILGNGRIAVPCIILETHREVELASRSPGGNG